MQLRTLITVIATLALQLVNTQNVTRGLELQAFPPCAVRISDVIDIRQLFWVDVLNKTPAILHQHWVSAQ